MKYRVVRPPGADYYLVQWSAGGIFRGYEKDWSARCLAPGYRPTKRFADFVDASRYIDELVNAQQDPGEKGPWQPTVGP